MTGVRFTVATSGTTYSWENDFVQGARGYFLIGSPRTTNLWRIARREVDHGNRLNFTLAPVELSIGIPSIDFGLMNDDSLRQHAEQHWIEFRNALSVHAPYGTVTAARNIVETVLYDYLLHSGNIKRAKHSLGELLKRLLVLLDRSSSSNTSFTLLDYHLMQKIRLLHGGIHADRIAARGPISPEIAMTVATDIITVLKSAGLAR